VKLRLNPSRRIRGCIGGGSSSQTSQPVTTASGSAVQNTGTNNATAEPGSIAVGTNAKYQEAGASDITGSDVSSGINRSSLSVSNGGSIVLGDPNADSLISQITGQFSSAISSLAGSSNSSQAAPGETLSYKTIGLILTAVTAVVGVLYFLFGRKRS